MDETIHTWDSRIGDSIRLRDLRILAVVARCGGMAKAAAELGISQPAVSQSIALLEEILGVRLLERTTRGTQLTPEGEAMVRRGIEAFDALDQGLADLRSLADPDSGTVVLAVSEAQAAAGFLADVLAAVSARSAGLSVRLIDQVIGGAERDLLRQRLADLVLARIDPLNLDDDLVATPLFEEDLVIVASGSLGSGDPGWGDLVDRRWILSPPGSAGHRLIERAFRRQGLPVPRAAIATQSMALRLNLLARGDYVTTLPASLAGPGLAMGRLQQIPLALVRPLPIALVGLRQRPPSVAVSAFIALAQEVMAARIASGDGP